MASKLPGLACAVVLASLPAASRGSEPFGPGEHIRWSVTYMKVKAGQAWAEVQEGDEGALLIRGGAKNADWYGRFYTIDDLVQSSWDPSGPGSRRYTTRFREGGFHQDQVMDIADDGIRVERSQRFDDGWRSWVDSYPGPGMPVEDPTTAFFRIRLLPLVSGERYTFPVFSGRETWELRVEVDPRTRLETALGEFEVIPVRLFTKHQGDLEQKGRIVLYLSDDERRLPVRAILQTNVGPIRADIISYTPTGP
jgi:hypothetical protein